MYLFVSLFFLLGQLNVQVNSDSALLINAESGAVLYEKKSKERFFPASTTKIITALYAYHKKKGAEGEKITASPSAIASISSAKKKASDYKLPSYWIDVGSSHMGIKAGEIFTFEELLYGLLVVSANDAANVIAEWVSGSVPAFVDEMNAFVKELGAVNTHLTNPHGNHHPDHYSSAEDLALITKAFLKEPLLRKIVSTVIWKRPETNKQKSVSLLQTNKLLRKGTEFYYPKAIGVKTGSGEEAKQNLVAAAADKERTLIAVLMHGETKKETFEDATKLFESAFNQPKVTKIYFPGGKKPYLCQIPGGKCAAKTYTREPLSFTHFKFDEPKLTPYLEWRLDLTAPLSQDSEVGDLLLKNERGETLAKTTLYTEEEVKPTLSIQLKRFLRGEAPFAFYLSIVFILVCVLYLCRRR